MEKKQRSKVYCKTDLLDSYIPVVESITGKRISKEKAWSLFKGTIFTAFELARDGKPLSLSGVGRFYTVDSARSLKVGKPAKRMRFSTSAKINEALNEDLPFMDPDVQDVTLDEEVDSTQEPTLEDDPQPVSVTEPNVEI